MAVRALTFAVSAVKRNHGLITRRCVVQYDNFKTERTKNTGRYSNMTVKEENTRASIVGDKYEINCTLDTITTKALLDTGAQVSIVSERQMKNIFTKSPTS